ncbi:amidohydrolase family protein [Streptomyces sp. NPDC005917]|uniref:dihydroorotase n=1 Tax=unclassified Streptomyces TaxID=2593676 RepID=UPI00340FE1E8
MAETEVDLLVAGGTVVTPEGRRRANIAVRDGRIAYLGPDQPRAAETVDAAGLMVLPGGVDTHVHLMDPGSTDREDFPTGTSAAAASGVTTIVEHSHGAPVRTVDDLRDKRSYLRDRANVDYGLAAHAWPGCAGEVADLWAAGVAFFKVFTCTTHGVPGHTAAALKEHLTQTALVGGVSLLHCEDESLTESAEELLKAEGRVDGGLLPQWRNRDAELVAASVAALLVRRTAARATIAHVSHPEVAAYVARERAGGARLAAEGCPQYFLLREDDVLTEGALRKFTPPARARTDEDEREMWRLLREGTLTHMSTDHAPSTLEQKRAGDIWNVHFGLPGLDSTMSLLLDAAARGHLAHEDVARVYSENPAKAYGLWPRKGRLGVGADADLILVDPAAEHVLRNEDVLSKAGWTPFDGRRVRGGVVRTYLRGTLVAEERKPLGERAGRFLPGAGHPRG